MTEHLRSLELGALAGQTTLIPLSEINSGRCCRVRQVNCKSKICSRLQELGVLEDSPVRVVKSGHNMICIVRGTRLALSSRIASRILVEPA